MNKKERDRLWEEFFEAKKNRSKSEQKYIEIKNKVAVEYLPLVEKIATKMSRHLTKVDIDDLKSYGFDGLYDVIDRFDKDKGVKFETYASLRIRGAIIDNIRNLDWVPRIVRQRNNEFQNIKNELELYYGKELEDHQIAEKMDLSEDEYNEFVNKSETKSLSSIDSINENEKNSLYYIDDKKVEDVDKDLLRKEMFNKLFSKGFSKIDRKIIYLFYYKNFTIEEISKEVGLGAPRISQLKKSIEERLKQKILRNPEYMEEFSGIIKR